MNTVMPKKLKPFYLKEIHQYNVVMAKRSYKQAFHHLERAHILGQPYPYQHSQVHWYMLKFGFSIKSWKEIRGQILRLLVGGVKSFIGKIPEGNTGGSNVPPLKKMEIPVELQQIIQVNK